MPLGTPVNVSGKLIGLAGSTGKSTGSHLHIQKRVNGVIVHPRGGGFNVEGIVTETGENSEIGKFVRIQSGNELWSYFHLSQIKVKAGDIISKGDDMPSTLGTDEVNRLSLMAFGYPASEGDYKAMVGKDSNTAIRWYFDNPAYRLRESRFAGMVEENERLKKQLAEAMPAAEELKPGYYKVK